jgi:phosphoribosylaminoimidazolecarboxamide formyltransferase / IMP cyclohydrolase
MPVRLALLSVSDKTGLTQLARALDRLKIPILSTGGTQHALISAGLSVRGIEDYTGSPEVMAGRVKTLHPRVHGGILARENLDSADLKRVGGSFIDLVVVNLYPFTRVLERENASFQDLIENIDIGGPCMVRAAAKNHERVTVVCDPTDYPALIEALDEHGEVPAVLRRRWAAKAFAHTAAYDAAIANWMASQTR